MTKQSGGTTMKKLALILATLFAFAAPAFADPVDGTWKTEVDDGAYAYVKISACGDKICGVISQTFKAEGEYQSENLGKLLVWDMVAAGDGSYGSGKIWQPSTDKIFKSKMVLSGDVLKVSGCVGPICKKQTWNRVN
jgi:uncharacterized protein (DUF2147 family)